MRQTQVACTPVCWLTFLVTSAFAWTFSVFHRRRSTREWHLPTVIMEGKNLMDRKSCLSTVRELPCLIRDKWVSSIVTSTLRSQLNKTSMVSYKYKLRSQVLELRWKKNSHVLYEPPLQIATEAAKLLMLKFHVTFLVQMFIFSTGSIDPWHALSVLTNLTTSEVAIFIPGTAHCADMNSDSCEDPPALRSARKVRHIILNDR